MCRGQLREGGNRTSVQTHQRRRTLRISPRDTSAFCETLQQVVPQAPRAARSARTTSFRAIQRKNHPSPGSAATGQGPLSTRVRRHGRWDMCYCPQHPADNRRPSRNTTVSACFMDRNDAKMWRGAVVEQRLAQWENAGTGTEAHRGTTYDHEPLAFPPHGELYFACESLPAATASTTCSPHAQAVYSPWLAPRFPFLTQTVIARNVRRTQACKARSFARNSPVDSACRSRRAGAWSKDCKDNKEILTLASPIGTHVCRSFSRANERLGVITLVASWIGVRTDGVETLMNVRPWAPMVFRPSWVVTGDFSRQTCIAWSRRSRLNAHTSA